jgi:hypothetical protein
MKKLAVLLVLGLGALQAAAAELKWFTGEEFPQALKQAQAESRFILIDFTGSDW